MTVTKLGDPGSGSVSSTPSSIACGAGCAGDAAPFLEGSQVVLTAAPAAGTTFIGWGGACAGAASTCTVTVTGDLTVTAAFGGAPAAVIVDGGGGQVATVGTAFAQPLAVTVVDGGGVAVPGVVVNFAAPAAGARAIVAPSATTDGNGHAQVIATAGAVAGSYVVTATVTGVPPASFALTNRGQPASVSVVSGSGSAIVTDPFAAPMIAVVRDANGVVVPGVTVSFAAPASGATATLAVASAVSDAAGQVSVDGTAGTIAGSYDVTATVVGVAAPARFARITCQAPPRR